MMTSIVLNKWRIIILSIGATLLCCTSISSRAIFGKLSRQHADRTLKRWAERLLAIARLPYSVKRHASLDAFSGRQLIFMSNHNSLYDIPLLQAALPGSVRMFAKKELFKIPFFAYTMRQAGYICVDREDASKAADDLKLARENMDKGINYWLAPEGTRAKDDVMLPFRKGGFLLALKAGAVIVPVGLRGVGSVLPTGSDAVQNNHPIELHIGEAIDCATYRIKDREAIMTLVRERIAICIGAQ